MRLQTCNPDVETGCEEDDAVEDYGADTFPAQSLPFNLNHELLLNGLN